MTRDGASPEQSIASVLDSLRRARVFLLDPGPRNIDCCRMIMAQCAEQTRDLIRNAAILRSAGRDFRESIELMRKELGVITALLASAAGYRRGMLQAMRAAAGPAAELPGNCAEKAQRVHVLC